MLPSLRYDPTSLEVRRHDILFFSFLFSVHSPLDFVLGTQKLSG